MEIVDVLVDGMGLRRGVDASFPSVRVFGRSYEHTRVSRAVTGYTAFLLSWRSPLPARISSVARLRTGSFPSSTWCQSPAWLPLPAISTTVGEPLPRHST